MRIFDAQISERRDTVWKPLAPFEEHLVNLGCYASSNDALEAIATLDPANPWVLADDAELFDWDQRNPESGHALIVGLGLVLQHKGYDRVPILKPDNSKDKIDGNLSTTFRDIIWPAGVQFLAVRRRLIIGPEEPFVLPRAA